MHPDSGYRSATAAAEFRYEEAALRGPLSLLPPLDDVAAPSSAPPSLAWAPANSALYAKRRACVSSPELGRRGASKNAWFPTARLQVSISTQTEMDESAASSAAALPPTAPNPSSLSASEVDTLSARSSVGDAAARAALVSWYRARLSAQSRGRLDLLVGRIAILADEMDAERGRPMRGGFLGLRLEDGPALGAFLAMPVPRWANDLLRWIGWN